MTPLIRAAEALTLACCLACGEEPRRGATGPNVVLVVVDTLRADRLQQYGHASPTSPGLERLASRATRFDDCTSPAPWTAPAVASLFTGTAPARHGVSAVGDALPAGAPTLASALQRAGWQTAAISFNPHVTRAAGFAPGFDEFWSYRGRARTAPDIRAMTARALEWIDEVRGDGPFFLYLQPMNVHGPYRVPEDARSTLLGRPPREGFEFFGPLMKELMNEGRVERRSEVTPDMLQSLEEQYDTAVRHTTDELGRFFAALDHRGLLDHSLIVVTSDHGEELFDHGGFAHRYSLHREVLHVPLFVKEPGQQTPRSVDAPVSLVDLRATVLELTGLRSASGDGRSLVPLLRGDDAEAFAKRPLLAEASNRRRFVGHSLRLGGEELIWIERSYDGAHETARLFDLGRDPGQQHDLAGERPERVRALRALLDRTRSELLAEPLEARRYEIDDDLREALEALGYL